MGITPQREEVREETVAREADETQYEAGAAIRRSSLWRDAVRRFVRNKAAVIALIAFVVMCGYVVFVPIFDHAPAYDVDFTKSYLPVSWGHPFGTDQFGRDMFVRTALGGRVSIGIGFAGTLVLMLVGILYGAISGFIGRWVDNALMRFLDTLYGLPFLPFAIIVIQIFGGTGTFWTMVLALTIVSWFTTARVMRGQVISLKENDYVRAARAIGARWPRVLFRHILPNTFGLIVVFVFLELPGIILGEAFLSFIGLGINPPKASWGSLAQDGYGEFLSHPYLIAIPSLAIAWLILSAFFIADGLRDALDPRAREV